MGITITFITIAILLIFFWHKANEISLKMKKETNMSDKEFKRFNAYLVLISVCLFAILVVSFTTI